MMVMSCWRIDEGMLRDRVQVCLLWLKTPIIHDVGVWVNVPVELGGIGVGGEARLSRSTNMEIASSGSQLSHSLVELDKEEPLDHHQPASRAT